jgi:hypothetical protein
MTKEKVLGVILVLFVGQSLLSAAKLNLPLPFSLSCLRSWSGADNRYGFFAPKVAAEKRLQFDIRGTNRSDWYQCELLYPRGEIRMRLATLAGSFREQHDFKDVVAASIAAWIFGRVPESQIVLVQVESYRIPTMLEYRGGSRASWETVQVYPFARLDSK